MRTGDGLGRLVVAAFLAAATPAASSCSQAPPPMFLSSFRDFPFLPLAIIRILRRKPLQFPDFPLLFLFSSSPQPRASFSVFFSSPVISLGYQLSFLFFFLPFPFPCSSRAALNLFTEALFNLPRTSPSFPLRFSPLVAPPSVFLCFLFLFLCLNEAPLFLFFSFFFFFSFLSSPAPTRSLSLHFSSCLAPLFFLRRLFLFQISYVFLTLSFLCPSSFLTLLPAAVAFSAFSFPSSLLSYLSPLFLGLQVSQTPTPP